MKTSGAEAVSGQDLAPVQVLAAAAAVAAQAAAAVLLRSATTRKGQDINLQRAHSPTF